MKPASSDHNVYETCASNFKPDNAEKDSDTQSYSSLDFEQMTTSAFNKNRRSSIKRSTYNVNNHNVSYGNGLIINGLLFDGQLFQQSRSSYILDYSNTPHDLNRFIEGHHTSANSSHLDVHLFKLSFIITLSEWHVDKELLQDYCPRYDNTLNMVDEVSYYKRFCFPELQSKERNGGNLRQESSTYIFTRTNADGQIEYGYCRRIAYDNNKATKFPVVICISNIRIFNETKTK